MKETWSLIILLLLFCLLLQGILNKNVTLNVFTQITDCEGFAFFIHKIKYFITNIKSILKNPKQHFFFSQKEKNYHQNKKCSVTKFYFYELLKKRKRYSVNKTITSFKSFKKSLPDIHIYLKL